MSASSSRSSDFKVLWHLLAGRIRGNTHQERLESFYQGQADAYDSFRARLLHGRQKMISHLDVPTDSIWIDFGAGTGENAEHFGAQLQRFKKGYLVDLSPSLLEVAQARVAQRNWSQIVPTEADATLFTPPERQVDVVTFSYSLTMIPNWFAAIDNAYRLLKPGGLIGVVDFYVAQKHPAENMKQHSWFTRSFWPIWFANDNVFPCKDHLPCLQNKFETIQFEEHYGKIPYMPILRAPYYLFWGRKPETTNISDTDDHPTRDIEEKHLNRENDRENAFSVESAVESAAEDELNPKPS